MTGCVQHPRAERDNQTGFLSNGNKLGGRHKTLLGPLPSNQGLKPVNTTGFKADNGLVMKRKLLFFKSLMKIDFHLQARHRTDVHLGVKDFVTGLAMRFGTMHRNLGIAYHIIGIFVPRGTQGDTNTHRGINLVTFYAKRLLHGFLQAIRNACSIACTG